MRHLRTSRLAALALSAAAACSTDLEPQYLVTDLRVLAVRSRAAGSASADVGPGDTLALDALFANPLGRTGLTVTWYGCLPEASERLPPCVHPDFLADPSRLASESAIPGSPVLLLGTCQASAPDDDACGITVALPPPAALEDALAFVVGVALSDPAFSCRLYAELPVVAVVEAEGRRAVALKRVRIAVPEAQLAAAGLGGIYVVNTNPAAGTIVRAPTDDDSCGGGIEVDGVEPFPAGRTVLCATTAGDAPQQFQTCGASGRETITEDLEWQWYVAPSGEFPEEDGVGNATGGRIDFVRPPGAFRLWAILRDERGGTSWLRADVGPVSP